ncbi:MAG TPA: ABC transporter substrate-binding protein, partial [Alphaproteobacteria bacterium]|nr:ABC transporter substrate-binding protein [Alphaproteobacteria bacterium]
MIRPILALAVAGLFATAGVRAETMTFERRAPGDGHLTIYSSTDLSTLRAAIVDFQEIAPGIEIDYIDLDT